MPTTNDLLTSLELAAIEESIVAYAIDPETRKIDIPKNFLLGVESDEKANRIYFTCPKTIGPNIDLTKNEIRVNYQNANGKKGSDLVDDVIETTEGVRFSWLLSRDVTEYKGSVSFTICVLVKVGSNVETEWNTIPATGTVYGGLEPDGMDEIRIFQGDSFIATLAVTDETGAEYLPSTEDRATFYVRKDGALKLEKSIPIDTMELVLGTEDTQSLPIGTYTYFVKLTKQNGEVYTIIPPSTLTIA